MKSIELNLREIRESKRLSQRKIAELMNITQSAYTRMESGRSKIRFNMLETFSKAVDMSLIDVIMYPEIWTQVVENDSQKQKLLQNTPIGTEVSKIMVECQHYKTKSELLEKSVETQQETVAFLRELVNKLSEK